MQQVRAGLAEARLQQAFDRNQDLTLVRELAAGV
jgi:hypothetical protein